MLNYSKINFSKLPFFEKISCVSQSTCPNSNMANIVWCTESGISYTRRVEKRVEGYTMTSDFICNQTDQVFYCEKLQTHLSQGVYYLIQLGGSSSSFLLMKVPSLQDDVDLSWNALNFLHQIGWIQDASQNIPRALNVPTVIGKSTVRWTSSEERIHLINAVPMIDIHWVWFRRNNYRLTQEIIERAYSWIALNPGCRFHLWTDILAQEDYEDFMSLIDPEWRVLFVKSVILHLQADTNQLIDEAFKNIESINPKAINGLNLLRAEFNCVQKQSRVFKTDFVRLFIIGTLGGVYVDFNDCVCLAPIRDIIAVHGYDRPLGVSDLDTAEHASNYFLYCPPSSGVGKLHLNTIIADMVEHVPHVITLIRNMNLCEVVRHSVKRVIMSLSCDSVETMDVSDFQKLYDEHRLPYCGNEFLNTKMWNKFVWTLIDDIAASVSDDIRCKIKQRVEYVKGTNRRVKPTFTVLDSETIDLMIAYIDDDNTRFNELFLFWWTDYNLRVLMHFTNLPIFCRMRKIPLVLLPFGYLLSYCCPLSWIGHIGDGTSYGMESRKRYIKIREYLT